MSDLAFPDVLPILTRLAQVPDLVLVGGQALNYWCTRYEDRVPELEAASPFTSKDVDFQGSVREASECARLLGGTMKRPTLDDIAISSALVQYRDEGGAERTIDFLVGVFGLDAAKVIKTSVPIPLDDEGSAKLRVMHPVLCLQSRVHNVVGLPAWYDNPNGVRQATAAVACAREFLRDTAAADPRQALDWSEECGRFACNDRALTIWHARGVDALGAIEPFDGLPSPFAERRLPQLMSTVTKRREAYARRVAPAR